MFKVVVFDQDNTREEFTSDPREEDGYETPFTTLEQAKEFACDVLYEGAVAAMIVRMVRDDSHIGEIMEFIFNTEK